MVIGSGAVVLGSLAVLGISPIVLSAFGLLSIGISALLTGSALGGKMIAATRN